MRMSTLVLLSLAATAAFSTQADTSLPILAIERNPAIIEYDLEVCAWRRALGERIAADPDPNIAWAGLLIAAQASCREDGAQPEPPPLPTTGAGRLMRHLYCAQTRRCAGTLQQWRAVEPDNLFVLGLSARARTDGEDPDTDSNDESCSSDASEFSRATRYADYYEETRALTATIVERYGFTPPTLPPGVDSQTSQTFYARSADFVGPEFVFRSALEEIRDDRSLSAAERLKFAELLIAVKGAPYAAQYGAQVGALAATGLAERDRYCRLALLGRASDAAVDAMALDRAPPSTVREFHRLLRNGNAIDAIEAVTTSLPVALRPKAVDPAHVAACVVHGPGFSVEDDLDDLIDAGDG